MLTGPTARKTADDILTMICSWDAGFQYFQTPSLPQACRLVIVLVKGWQKDLLNFWLVMYLQKPQGITIGLLHDTFVAKN